MVARPRGPQRGDIWWTDLPEPIGSGPGYRRPVLIVQSNRFNNSAIDTVVVVILTSNLRLADAPGNVLLSARRTPLDRDSVINVSQIVTLDRGQLTEFVGTLPAELQRPVDEGLRLVLQLPGRGSASDAAY